MIKILAQSGENHPNAIPGLVSWYDASEPGTLSRDDAFASKFYDKAPGGYLMHADGLSCPKILQSRFKGKTILRFENAEQQMLSNATLSSNVDDFVLIAIVNGKMVVNDWSVVGLESTGLTIPNNNHNFRKLDIAEILLYKSDEFAPVDLIWVTDYLKRKWDL